MTDPLRRPTYIEPLDSTRWAVLEGAPTPPLHMAGRRREPRRAAGRAACSTRSASAGSAAGLERSAAPRTVSSSATRRAPACGCRSRRSSARRTSTGELLCRILRPAFTPAATARHGRTREESSDARAPLARARSGRCSSKVADRWDEFELELMRTETNVVVVCSIRTSTRWDHTATRSPCAADDALRRGLPGAPRRQRGGHPCGRRRFGAPTSSSRATGSGRSA